MIADLSILRRAGASRAILIGDHLSVDGRSRVYLQTRRAAAALMPFLTVITVSPDRAITCEQRTASSLLDAETFDDLVSALSRVTFNQGLDAAPNVWPAFLRFANAAR